MRNSAKIKVKKTGVFILTLVIILSLTGCSVDTIPEWIAGKVIQAILYRDRDLFFYESEEIADNPEEPRENIDSSEPYGEEEDAVPDEPGIEDPEPETEEDGEESGEAEEDLHGESTDDDNDEEEDPEVSGDTASDEDTASENSADSSSASDMEDDKRAYYFSTLESEDKKLYLEIYNSIFNMESDVVLSSTDADRIDRIFNLCMMDHPELFFCDGYKSTVTTRNEETVQISFTGKYNCTVAERKNTENSIKKAAEKVLSGVPKNENDYEKVKYIFEWIIDHTEYDTASADNQNIKSVLLNGRSVCQGYTMTMKYLLDKMGIFCTVVYGNAANEAHAWNLVKMDGTYCYVDTTWGDSSYRTGDNKEANRTSYNYFGCNSDILLRTHTVSEKGKLPECTSLDEYYYVKESKYFTSVDKDRLKAVFDHEASLGEHMFTIRASSEEVYNDLYDTLFNERMIFELVQDADSVTYIEDKNEYTLTFTV